MYNSTNIIADKYSYSTYLEKMLLIDINAFNCFENNVFSSLYKIIIE